jgi:hypothetical protein
MADSPASGQPTQAQRFKLDVELAGNRWPDGWIKDFGYRNDLLAEPSVADQPFLAFAIQCVRDKTWTGCFHLSHQSFMGP